VVRVAVVGYVEWTEYVTLDDVPRPGWRLRSRGVLEAPGASASVVAVQLAKLGARAELFTTLAKDPNAERMARFFAEQGVEVHAAERPGIQPRSLALLDLGANERSLIAFDRANEPALADRLPWERLDDADSIVFTGGDRPLLERVRAATELLIVHALAAEMLVEAGVEAELIVGSGRDDEETRRLRRAGRQARLVVETKAEAGGRFVARDAAGGAWSAIELPGPAVDSCGCGANFLAGVAFALAAGESIESALETGARCGASCLTGQGPFAGQLKR